MLSSAIRCTSFVFLVDQPLLEKSCEFLSRSIPIRSKLIGHAVMIATNSVQYRPAIVSIHMRSSTRTYFVLFIYYTSSVYSQLSDSCCLFVLNNLHRNVRNEFVLYFSVFYIGNISLLFNVSFSVI